MTLAIETILSVLVFSTVVGAGAEPKDRWVCVEGGSWVPSAEMVARIKKQIESFVSTQAKIEGRELQEWTSYTFQYQGQETHAEKYVFVNAFCVNDSAQHVNKEMVVAFDGGTCFFSLKYDPKENRFFDLLINGEA